MPNNARTTSVLSDVKNNQSFRVFDEEILKIAKMRKYTV